MNVLNIRRGRIAACLLAIMATSSAVAQEEKKSSVPFLKIGSASVGTTVYQLSIKLSEMWSKIPGLSVSALPGSAISNARDIGLNRIQIGMTSMKTQYDSTRGEGGYEKYEGLRYMLPWQLSNLVWVVRADSDIKTIADFKDKHVMPGAEGSTSKLIGLLALEANGITPESIRKTGGRMSSGAVGTNITMMQDRQLDAMMITVPQKGFYTPILPIENSVGVRFIPMDEKTIEYLLAKMPTVVRSSVDGGIYKNQPNPYVTVAEGYAFSVRSDLPDDLVYRLTKMVWENADEIVAINPHFYAYRDIKNALQMANIPLHPGAAKYYVERGLTLKPEHVAAK